MTIAELKAAGLRLGMTCHGCNRFRYLALNRSEDDTVVEEIGATLICSRCRTREVTTAAVHPDAKTGFWPAEFS